MQPLPRNLTLSLNLIQALGWAALVRSVAFGFWTTVVASILLIVGASTALRGRTWGIGLVLATATAFPVVAMLGVSVPGWFWLVGILGAVPFAMLLKPMARFDAGATALFAALAGVLAFGSAVVWRAAAIAMYYGFHACH